MNSIWFSEISGRKLHKKQSLKKLPRPRLKFLFCFTTGTNLAFVDSVQGRLLILVFIGGLGGIQLISQGKFIPVHHHFTFNLLYGVI